MHRERLNAPSANMSASYFDGYLHAAFVTVPAKHQILLSLTALLLSPGQSNDGLLAIVELELEQGCHANLPSGHSSILGLKLLLPMGCVKLGNQFAVCSPTEGR